MQPAAVLGASLFAIWSSFVKERVGISYGVAEADIFAEKLWSRAQDAGFPNLLDYYYYLRYDDPGARELDALIDALVVGESYLFRELDQIEMAVTHLIAPAVAERGRARVWSAACAGGEEPLTVAMALADRGLLGSVDLVASDVSRRALARAKQHTYSRRALRSEPPPRYRRFLEITETQVRVATAIASAIEWRRLNLVDPAAAGAPVACDVVLCRNVLIYFDDQTVVNVVDRVADCLRPGGALLVGVSESLLRLGTSLICEEHGGVFVYRKAS